MSQYIWRLLGYEQPESYENASKTTRGLSSSWYRSDAIYELERRAIFSKRWILVTHRNRFTEPGDYVRFEEAGFRFFICRDREGTIQGFHNVCRHRAFPVVSEAKGQMKIISCKYHGWSYGLNGKLAKAPGYEEMEGFDKSKNGLFPINIHVDALGFVWVNLDTQKEIQWKDDFEGVDTQPRLRFYNFDDYHFDHTWEMSGDYNWKTLADNYNECYHCPTAHPDAAPLTNIKIYSVDTKAGHVQHWSQPKEKVEAGDTIICSSFYFPNACMTVSPHFFYMMRCVPTSSQHCSMEYEVYRHKDASDEDFENIDAMFKRILGEDKWLCNETQKNLNAGIYVSGEMHSRMEKGPLFLQRTVRKHVQDHYDLEQRMKREIWPARQVLPDSAETTKEDELFCAGLACGNDKLAW